jgi:hypothetical protein
MERKYIIYKNDLKFREDRNIDINKIDWNQNNIKHLMKTDHDSIEYRLDESKNTNFIDLDLEMMKLNSLPTFLKNDIFLNLKHLFLSNNSLVGKIDISFLKKLEILDITNNKINEIIIPSSLIELSACNNTITKFISNNKLKRLKISNNKICEFNISDTIEILEINNNLINECNFSKYKELKRLIIFTNPLKNILLPINCTYIDISDTKIEKIDNLYKIEHLVLNNCNFIRNLPQSDNIKTLEIVGTTIDKLYFYKNYELILLQLDLTKNISSKYKDSNADIQIKKNKFLVISIGLKIFDE